MSSIEIAQLIVEGEKIRGSLDNLNTTLRVSEAHVTQTANMLSSQWYSFVQSQLPILHQIQSTLTEVQVGIKMVEERTSITFIISIVACIFAIFGMCLFLALVGAYEYRCYREKRNLRLSTQELLDQNNGGL